MGDQGRLVSPLYHGDKFIANVTIFPQTKELPFKPGEELRVSSFSTASDRCLPLVVLYTVASQGVLFKLEPPDARTIPYPRDLEILHSACLKELKTAVIPMSETTELHLVPMNGSRKQCPCFWGFVIMPRLYSSCLTMLNLRCLALVFDLDETLVVANTLRSFEDRIDALGSKIKVETDSQKLSGMSSELKRYMQDRVLLKQFIEEDHVWDNTVEKYVNAQAEVVPPLSEGGLPLMRPVVRLQDRNMIFTRINPNVRDTSVLVRLRPAWEELRSYLTAKGRKRFEVFVCTMAEKEYAYEMWRLLDPEAQLIQTREMIERVVCVKSGSKKSLMTVFANGNCHPKMAMVIDDRLKVWEDGDQSSVHVVPAFAPYYAPQAETNSPLPILCVARNVACTVRGSYFRDFDEGLSKKLTEVDFDTDVSTLPHPPVVSNYLMAEEEPNPQDELGNGGKHFSNGMADAETEKRLTEKSGSDLAKVLDVPREGEEEKNPFMQQNRPNVTGSAVFRPQLSSKEGHLERNPEFPNLKSEVPILRHMQPVFSESSGPSLQSSPVREDGEVPESEVDPDTRRRLLILQHGQDTQHFQMSPGNQMDSSFSIKVPSQSGVISHTPAGGWLGAEEEMSLRQLSMTSSALESEMPAYAKQRSHGLSLFGVSEVLTAEASAHDLKRCNSEELKSGSETQRLELFSRMPPELLTPKPSGFQPRSSSSVIYPQTNPVNCLQEISEKCNLKLEFKSVLNTTKELQFSVEVLLSGEHVGEGVGRTKKEAQIKAADNALRFMGSKFMSHQALTVLGHANVINSSSSEDSAPRWNSRDPRFLAGLGPCVSAEEASVAKVSGQVKTLDIQDPRRTYNPIAALKDYCTMEGVTLNFKVPSPSLLGPELPLLGSVCQVEVAGIVMGKGSGWSWEEAKQQAAEEALKRLRPMMLGRGTSKRASSPRSPPVPSNKRGRPGERLQRFPSSPRNLSPRRYARDGPNVL